MPWVVLSFSQLCHLLLCANLLAPSCWYLWHKLSTNLMGGSIVYSRTLSDSRKMTSNDISELCRLCRDIPLPHNGESRGVFKEQELC